MEQVIMWIMAAGAVVGGLDRLFGGRLGLGGKFEEGFLYLGPTALSMVACGLTGDGTLTPARIAAWADARGYAGAGGTSWEMMYAGCEAFGLRAEEIPLTESAVYGALEAGRPIICSVRPGDFTTVGHFIVLAGVQDDRLRVLDPNSPARSAQAWDYQRLEPQIKALWAYDAA